MSRYIGTNGRNEALSLGVPTRGLPGPDGFTTVIIQGRPSHGNPPEIATYIPLAYRS